MNKGKIILAFSIMALTLAGCGVGNVGENEDNGSNTENIISQEGYENSLNGLCSLLYDNGLISGEQKEMSAGFIGAEKGVKYQFKVNKSLVNVELYDYGSTYDLLDDSIKQIIDEVKNNGEITIVEEKFPAVVSNNGRYLMIYNDLSKEKDNIEKCNKAKEVVKSFKE